MTFLPSWGSRHHWSTILSPGSLTKFYRVLEHWAPLWIGESFPWVPEMREQSLLHSLWLISLSVIAYPKTAVRANHLHSKRKSLQLCPSVDPNIMKVKSSALFSLRSGRQAPPGLSSKFNSSTKKTNVPLEHDFPSKTSSRNRQSKRTLQTCLLSCEDRSWLVIFSVPQRGPRFRPQNIIVHWRVCLKTSVEIMTKAPSGRSQHRQVLFSPSMYLRFSCWPCLSFQTTMPLINSKEICHAGKCCS